MHFPSSRLYSLLLVAAPLLSSVVATSLSVQVTVKSTTTTTTTCSTKQPVPTSSPKPDGTVTPKFFIISMFAPEGEVWYGIPQFDLLARNITVLGLSPLFPDVHCTAAGDICQLTTGEAEINAATTIASLVASPHFNLKKTYFMIAGIAGVNPETATINSVTFARYAVQVALQYEFDAREIPANYSTGYVPQGATSPGGYPQEIYGTEVFEVNTALRQYAIDFAKTAKLMDTAESKALRAKYQTTPGYRVAAQGPQVVPCDVATSDVYFSGALLGEAFSNYTRLITNGTGVYCTTAQEDNATLEALLRAAKAPFKKVDFSRVIVMRTCSDFDRPYKGEADTVNLYYEGIAYPSAVQNIYIAGIKVVEGIVNGWDNTFEKGIAPKNYIGDIFGTLGGTPDFGLPSQFISNTGPLEKRALSRRSAYKAPWKAQH